MAERTGKRGTRQPAQKHWEDDAPWDDDETPRRARRRIFTRGRVYAGILAVFGGFIVLNAVALQTEKHPAPMFKAVARAPETLPLPPRAEGKGDVKSAAFAPTPMGGAKPASLEKGKPQPMPEKTNAVLTKEPPAQAAEASEALVSEIQRALAMRGYYKGDADGKTGPMTTQAIRDFQFAQRRAVDGKPSEGLLKEINAVRVTMKDELLDLVKRTGADDKSNRTVLDVQRALNKAGYGPLNEDGNFGPSTKTALTKFEQDKKLPPKGEPKGPVLRALASASGVKIAN